MPPKQKSQLSDDQINLVYQWILNGAPKTPQQKVERPKTLSEILRPYFDKPETIDYKLVNEMVFEPKCNKCHSRNSPQAQSQAIGYGQNMTTYADLFKTPDNPFNPGGIVRGKLFHSKELDEAGNLKKVEGSRIYVSVAKDQRMPPAKEGYEPLSGLELKLLRLWIINCAIEDYEAIKDDDELIEKAVKKKEDKVRSCLEAS